jgi:hypothetical protein
MPVDCHAIAGADSSAGIAAPKALKAVILQGGMGRALWYGRVTLVAPVLTVVEGGGAGGGGCDGDDRGGDGDGCGGDSAGDGDEQRPQWRRRRLRDAGDQAYLGAWCRGVRRAKKVSVTGVMDRPVETTVMQVVATRYYGPVRGNAVTGGSSCLNSGTMGRA